MRIAIGRAVVLGMGTAGSIAGWGCGGGMPSVSSSTREVNVTGTVTVHGRPATGGEITFDPSNVNRRGAPARTAKIGPDGAFAIATLVGENAVTVRGPEVRSDPRLTMNRKGVVVKPGDALPITLP